MKNFTIGLTVGLLLGGGIAWAAVNRMTLVNSREAPIGTAENPLYIQ